jgi:hypothetical protein
MSEHNLRNRHARDRETNWGVAPEAVQPRADASAWPVIGIDVSHHQGEVNFLSAKEAGYTFVFLKATEGSTFVDPRFASNRERAAAAGMLVGAYHFFRPKSDATAQALHFVRTVGSLRNRELPPVIDIEDNRLWEGITSDAAMKMVQRFCDVVRRDLGVEPIFCPRCAQAQRGVGAFRALAGALHASPAAECAGALDALDVLAAFGDRTRSGRFDKLRSQSLQRHAGATGGDGETLHDCTAAHHQRLPLVAVAPHALPLLTGAGGARLGGRKDRFFPAPLLSANPYYAT